MQYQSLIKANHLKDLVQKDAPCNQILNSIERLLGLPESNKEELKGNDVEEKNDAVEEESISSAEAENESEVSEKSDLREESVAKILDGLNGRERKLAASLLSRVEESERLNYDYETHEILIDGERLLHSNVKALILKCIRVRAPQLPTYLVEFLSVLVDAKCPLNLFQDSDVLNIRRGLLKLKKETNIEKRINEEEDLYPGSQESKKRTREVDEEEEKEVADEPPAKIQKIEEIKGKKRKLEDSDETLNPPPKRSTRLQLKQNLRSQWQSIR